MTLLSRWTLAALFLLALAGTPAAAVTPAPWPQAHSDLPVDSSIRFGTLPNGMRYAIKRNTTPTGGISLRFRIDAGSLMEHDNEQGIAHVLEHMAFRGSAHVADGDMVKTLQSLGLTFGADTNAFTAATQTVYSFDMPKNDETSVNAALMLMREIAGELKISQDALDTERNVVLAEARLYDVPGARARKSENAFLYGERAGAALVPIGLQDIITHATAPLVRGFYEAWYRPERATLIIVGDVDPVLIEAKIKAKFADWKPKAKPRPVHIYHPPAAYPQSLRLFAETGVQPYAVFHWIRPYDGSPDSKANETRDLLRYIAIAVLNQRLAEASHGANPPFIQASADRSHVANVADVTELLVTHPLGKTAESIDAVERICREALARGVRQDEVDSIVSQLRSFYQSAADAADTTPSSQLVMSLLRSVDDKTVYTSPASDVVLFEAAVKGLTAAKISATLKFVLGGKGPLVFTSTPEPIAGGYDAVKKALATAATAPLTAATTAGLPAWPYDTFGAKGTVASQRTVDDLGLTYVRFANGVTLTVKPTQLHAGQVLMAVRLGNGRIGLPRDHVSPAWVFSSNFIQGGLAHYSIDDLQKRMSGRQWGASFSVGDDEFLLRGQARAADLEAEMQVLAAYVTDPSFKPEAFEQARIAIANNYAESESSPSAVFSREFAGLIHDGDTRWRTPTAKEIAAATLGDEKALVAPALKDGPIDVTVVGDMTVDQAIAAVATTFGALPQRPDAGPAISGEERFPKGTPQPVVLTHHGAANQALAAIVWPTPGFYRDMKLPRTLRVLSEIFASRLLDELRTKEGITYTPGASSSSSLVSPDYGYLYAVAQIPPDKIANFYAEVANVADDLTAIKVSDAELERARGPRIQDIQKQQQTNEYWLQLLTGSAQDPRLLDVIRTTIPDLQAVTAEDVQKAAKDWIKDDKAFLVVVVPDGMAPPTLPH